MGDNKSESYLKLRSLYEQRFFQSVQEGQVRTPNRIHFANQISSAAAHQIQAEAHTLAHPHTHSHTPAHPPSHSRNAQLSTQHTQPPATSRNSHQQTRNHGHLHIDIQYTPVGRRSEGKALRARLSTVESRPVATSNAKRSSQDRNWRTLPLQPSRDSVTAHTLRPKKYSLISMIHETKRLKRASHLKLCADAHPHTPRFRQTAPHSLCDFTSRTALPNSLKSFKLLSRTHREEGRTHREAGKGRSPREYSIDPWVVSEAEDEPRKYF